MYREFESLPLCNKKLPFGELFVFRKLSEIHFSESWMNKKGAMSIAFCCTCFPLEITECNGVISRISIKLSEIHFSESWMNKKGAINIAFCCTSFSSEITECNGVISSSLLNDGVSFKGFYFDIYAFFMLKCCRFSVVPILIN